MNVAAEKSSQETKGRIWHRRYGHLRACNLEELVRHDMVDGFDYNSSEESDLCESCVTVVSFHRIADVVKGNLS